MKNIFYVFQIAKCSNEASNTSAAFQSNTSLNSSLNSSSINQTDNKVKTEQKVIAKVKVEDFIPTLPEKTTVQSPKIDSKKPAFPKQQQYLSVPAKTSKGISKVIHLLPKLN